MKKILVLNSGSSTLKYQLFGIEGDRFDVIAKGNAERIGDAGSFVSIKIGENEKVTKNAPMPTHLEALHEVMDLLLNGALKSLDELDGVGHRLVHGGEYYNKSVLINDEVIKNFEELSVLAPLHNPANLLGVRAITKLLPKVKQVGVFDTAFHQTMEKEAYLYALPIEQYEKHKIRRYGFHGTSHYFVSERAAEMIGKKGKIIVCHLGNGASLSAVDNGKCVDTSMGFTPLAGVVMGTRTGDIDPYVALHIMKTQGLSVDEVNNMLNKQSGMAGLCGFPDMRDVEDRYLQGEPVCMAAMDSYIHAILRFIGSYVAVLGGVDAIVFTAGVGENSKFLREKLLERLGYLGIEVDDEANSKRGVEIEISKPGSKVKAYVIPTNEELVIAQDTVKICSAGF